MSMKKMFAICSLFIGGLLAFACGGDGPQGLPRPGVNIGGGSGGGEELATSQQALGAQGEACDRFGNCNSGLVCQPNGGAGICVCDDDNDCPGSTVCCGATGGFTCAACNDDNDCFGQTPYCKNAGLCGTPAVPSCEECLNDTHCSGAEDICDPLSNKCVECMDDSDCAADDYCANEATGNGVCMDRAELDELCTGEVECQFWLDCCGGFCRNTEVNSVHCGECGNGCCGIGGQCAAGECQPACDNYTDCDYQNGEICATQWAATDCSLESAVGGAYACMSNPLGVCVVIECDDNDDCPSDSFCLSNRCLNSSPTTISDCE